MIRAVVVVVGGLALAPAEVRAHSDPARFGEPAALGGGGGRYFTGSPEDGLACSVCHHGGTAPRVVLDGLPVAYEPGMRSTVTLRWEDPEVSHALALELVDAQGRHPELALVDADALPAKTRCEGDPSGAPAAWVMDLEPRRVLVVQDCGASEVSLTFTAPDEPELYFAAAIVRSDRSATAEGDGVLELRRVIPRAGLDPGGCAVARPPSASPAAHGWWVALLLLLGARGRPVRVTGIRRRTSR